MLSAALVAAWAAASADTEVAGVMAAVGLGLALGLLLGGIMVALRGDQVVVGIAFNILALGLTSYALDVITGRGGLKALSVPSGSVTVRIPGLADIPWIGALFDQHYLAYVAYILVPTIFYLLFRTGLGTRLRACGEFAEGSQATGINVMRWRVLAMGASGVLAALAGAYLVLGDIRLFQQNMSGGRGYIALAVIILGRWTPFGALAAACLIRRVRGDQLRGAGTGDRDSLAGRDRHAVYHHAHRNRYRRQAGAASCGGRQAAPAPRLGRAPA